MSDIPPNTQLRNCPSCKKKIYRRILGDKEKKRVYFDPEKIVHFAFMGNFKKEKIGMFIIPNGMLWSGIQVDPDEYKGNGIVSIGHPEHICKK